MISCVFVLWLVWRRAEKAKWPHYSITLFLWGFFFLVCFPSKIFRGKGGATEKSQEICDPRALLAKFPYCFQHAPSPEPVLLQALQEGSDFRAPALSPAQPGTIR